MRKNDMKVFVVLEGDQWVSSDSMRIRGVFSEWSTASKAILEDLEEIDHKTKMDVIWEYCPNESMLTDEEVEEVWGKVKVSCLKELRLHNQFREFDRSYQIQEYEPDLMMS